jgi:hypothetical protein
MFDQSMTGAGRFAQCVAALHQNDENLEVVVLSEDVKPDMSLRYYHVPLSRKSSRRVVAYWYKSRDYADTIRDVISRVNIDVIFFNDAWLAYHWMRSDRHIPTIVFIHDDNAMRLREGNMTAFPGLFLRRKMESFVVRSVEKILTNSEYMRSALIRAYQVSHERIAKLRLAFTDYSSIPFIFNHIDERRVIRVLFWRR